MQRQSLLVVSLLLGVALQAQRFGGNPASVRWKQVNTDTVRVIFPAGMESSAQRVAGAAHLLQRNHSRSIGDQVRKISIVLHDQTLVSNGYVGLAPYRSEFYLTPPQDPFQLGAVNWADNLAVHEFRHVQQYSNFNKGLSKAASVILGEQGQFVANAAAVPDWFFEGDAVFNETKLTRQGRGVLPLFLSSYQSLYRSGKQYSYQQLRNGSLRRYMPDHYDLGYLLVAYGRKQYGDDIWRKVTDDAARFKPLFYPFQGAVKKHMGIPFNRFVNDALQYYRQQWQAEKEDTPTWITTPEKNTVNNYHCPYVLEDGSVLVLKNSYRKIPAFYKIISGREERIAVRGIAIDDYYSYKNGTIVYSSYRPDARWGFREFTDIRTIDIRTGEEQTLATGSKYLSPDISSDGKRIVTVEMEPFMRSRLVVLDRNGALQDSVGETGIQYSHPKFAADDRHYYVAARNDRGEMALLKYGSGKQALLGYTNNRIGYLTVRGDTVLFTISNGARDEIWALIDGKQARGPYRLASYATGLYQAVIRPDGKLLAAAFTADGYRLGLFSPAWQPAAAETGSGQPLYIPGVYQTADHEALDRLPANPYPVSVYPKSHRLFNVHSWRPYFEDPDYSFTVYGQNVLNTLQTELAYSYNYNEHSHKLSAAGIFGGTYVQPLVGVSQTWQRAASLTRDTSVSWNELAGYAGLQLPLNLTGGRQYRYLTLSGTFHVNKVSWTGLAQKFLRDREVDYLTLRLRYSGQIQQARQQIYPHWGQGLLLQYRTAVNQQTARQFLGVASLYLPALANSHSLVLTAAYHGRDTLNRYLFSNDFPFARGYREVDFPRMWKFGVNYHFPLLYPDLGLGQIVYFLRIRANLFYDYSRGRSLRTGTAFPFNTVGTEIYFDTRWWNQQPVTFGVRYNHLLNNEFRGGTNPDNWELILPVNLF
ncbi:TolB family protein [Sediminibacterium soli]|uniref:TolB family protein n=1 Tax=Sediminibacterium soli TaxID=2698829 RepID=UPI00137A97C5|nr:hypothetical protein [Sediminibacterium soli]NCI45857.1 hypothetical protein [Sediminibacterium soli]